MFWPNDNDLVIPHYSVPVDSIFAYFMGSGEGEGVKIGEHSLQIFSRDIEFKFKISRTNTKQFISKLGCI